MASQEESRPLKFTLTHYRKPERTHEEFMKWIVETHLPLALPVLKKHGAIRYALFETPPALNTALKEGYQTIRPTWDFAEYDCFIEYTLPNMECIAAVMADPDWAESVKDQDEWVDVPKALLSIGYYTPYLLETGEIVNLK